MKVIILAGGFGTRLGKATKKIPKPLVKVSNRPIISHIMDHYKKFGYDKFIVLGGYKHRALKEYFKNNKNVQVIYTGLKTLTGGRLKRIEKIFNFKENFFFTYGDAVSDINLNKLLKFHIFKKSMVTVTAVNPNTKYGLLDIAKSKRVIKFSEKPKLKDKWISGGFFIINQQFLKYLKNDKTTLEKEPFEKIAERKKFFAFKHNKFWACMDTQRDLEFLKKYWLKNKKFS